LAMGKTEIVMKDAWLDAASGSSSAAKEALATAGGRYLEHVKGEAEGYMGDSMFEDAFVSAVDSLMKGILTIQIECGRYGGKVKSTQSLLGDAEAGAQQGTKGSRASH